MCRVMIKQQLSEAGKNVKGLRQSYSYCCTNSPQIQPTKHAVNQEDIATMIVIQYLNQVLNCKIRLKDYS